MTVYQIQIGEIKEKKRALFGVPNGEFGQETSCVLDVRSSGVAVREKNLKPGSQQRKAQI